MASSTNSIFDNFLMLSKVAFVGFVASTMFLKIKSHPLNEVYGNLYQSALFYGLVHMLFNGFSELTLLISRLPVFFKQRGNLFYPTWTWILSSWILQVPYSIVESIVWTCVVYYTIGLAPAAGRYFILHPLLCFFFKGNESR